jgi:tetratricopeptide (TPR) repeat protein
MRLAMVATPAALPDLRPAPGSLDGDMVRARLALPDASFRVVDLDPAVDIAEQIELFFDREDASGNEPILFYASCRIILSVDGELFLSVNPAEPDTGDSLRDIALVFRERARGPLAFVLECRHSPDPTDPFRSAAVVSAAKEAVAAAGGAIELLVAAHPVAESDAEDSTSRLTRALIEALDDPDAGSGLTLGGFFGTARESPSIAGAVPCFAHVRGKSPFELLPFVDRPEHERRYEARREAEALRDTTPDEEAEQQAEPEHGDEQEPEPEHGREQQAEPEHGGEQEAEPEPGDAPEHEHEPEHERDEEPPAEPEREAAPVSGPVVLPEPRPPYRSVEVSIPVVVDEPEPLRIPLAAEAAPPPEPRPPYRSVSVSVDLEGLNEPPPEPVSLKAEGAAVLPQQRSFRRSEPPPPPRVVVSEPPPSPARTSEPARQASAPPPPPTSARPSEPAKQASVPPVAPPPPPSERLKRSSAAPPREITAADHVTLGDALVGAGDLEAAHTSYKRALGMLGSTASGERAEIYVRLGQIKQAEGKRREAIATLEKALALFPTLDGLSPMPTAERAAMEALIELNIAEGDFRAVASAEERMLATIATPDERYARLFAFAVRWQDEARDPARARAGFERARALKPDDTALLERLAALYQGAGMLAEALVTQQKLAGMARDPRERAERYFALGKQCIGELRKDELGLELFDLALESDPTMLEPLALVARVLADRQEWSQLERAYRRMLERVDKIPRGVTRTEVTFELCRRLGMLFRDHLDDPALGLDAFEDALRTKPTDLPTVLLTADLARALGKYDRAAVHLASAAALEPSRAATYHDLFETFQKLRRPDQAFQAATVTMLLRQADARERFIFEENKPDGVPKLLYPMPAEGWEWLRPSRRDVHAEAVLAAVTPAAIAVRLAQLAGEGRLPPLDPSLRQDPEKSTISIVRSFGWASHFLAVPAPAIYFNDDRDLALASVIAEEPTVIVGARVQRGKSLAELALLVGRHLAYHVGAHRLLLYYPSIEELTNCFLAAIRIVLPEVPAPVGVRAAVAELERGISSRLSEASRVDLAAAVAAFEANGSRVHLADWAADVERCATRAGFLLAGDIEVSAALLRSEPRAVLEPEDKVADLLAFAVSEEHHALRESLGIAIQP